MRARLVRCLPICFSMSISLCLSMCVGLSTSLPASAQQGRDDPLSAQERLDAIRQSLVEATLQTPTRVATTSWIDAQGSLRESSSFKNGMVVRGVRVLAYGRDETGQAKARVQTSPMNGKDASEGTPTESKESGLKEWLQNLNQGVRKDEVAATACTQKVGAQMNHVVSLDVNVEPSANSMVMQYLLPQIQSLWVNSAPSTTASQAKPWRAVNSLPPASMGNDMSAYERAVISHRASNDPWQTSLRIRTQTTPSRGFEGYPGYKAPGVALYLEYQMQGTEGQAVKLQDSAQLILDIDRPTWGAPRLNSASMQAVKAQLQTWRDQSEQLLHCQHLNPVVTAVAGQQIQINAGSLAGVRKGDEWLVADPVRFPSELAGKEGAPQTLLAKVQAVTPHNSQLVILAGPVQAVQAEWRAWPTETLLKEPNLLPSPHRPGAPAKKSTKPVTSANTGFGFSVND